jgi:hypothetical protein
MVVKFVPNPVGIAELGRTPQMGEAVGAIAEQVAESVRTIGPVDADDDVHYVDEITVEVGLVGPFMVGRVNANKITSGWIEFGSIHNPPFAPLRHACEMNGLVLGLGV